MPYYNDPNERARERSRRQHAEYAERMRQMRERAEDARARAERQFAEQRARRQQEQWAREERAAAAAAAAYSYRSHADHEYCSPYEGDDRYYSNGTPIFVSPSGQSSGGRGEYVRNGQTWEHHDAEGVLVWNGQTWEGPLPFSHLAGRQVWNGYEWGTYSQNGQTWEYHGSSGSYFVWNNRAWEDRTPRGAERSQQQPPAPEGRAILIGLLVAVGVFLIGITLEGVEPVRIMQMVIMGFTAGWATIRYLRSRPGPEGEPEPQPTLKPWSEPGPAFRSTAHFEGAADWHSEPEPEPEPDPEQSSTGFMTRSEAFEVLGLALGASEAEIIHAHHTLIKKFHPDHGGSTAQAARINRAKDVLMGVNYWRGVNDDTRREAQDQESLRDADRPSPPPDSGASQGHHGARPAQDDGAAAKSTLEPTGAGICTCHRLSIGGSRPNPSPCT